MQGKLLKSIKRYITGDLVFSFANSLVGLIRGPIVMLFIPLFLSENTQGYWYTFGSLSALSVFADLGFGAIVGQFSAHEFAHLRFDKDKTIIGEPINLERMSSLYKFILKWASCVCLVAFPIILVIGFMVLRTHDAGVNWQLPWLIMIFTSGFNFVSRISLTFLEGCGQIKNIQINNLVGAIISAAATITMLALRCDLYALVIPGIINAIVSVTLMIAVFRKPLVQLLKIKVKTKFNWGKNFLSLLWKYALSWSSGYFIFQIYTPLAFLMYDPSLAGKVGITMTLVQACFNISNTWNAVLVPKMNMALAGRDWGRAEGYAKKGGLLSVATYLFGGAIILIAIGFLQDKISILSRFLGIVPVTILLGTYLLQLPINTIATYGRGHKQEPFLWMSMFGAVIIGGSTLVLVAVAPIDYLFTGFLLANVVSLFVFVWMYKNKKQSWHEKFIKLQDREETELRAQIALGVAQNKEGLQLDVLPKDVVSVENSENSGCEDEDNQAVEVNNKKSAETDENSVDVDDENLAK